jgi:hypothetical protein
MKTAPYQSRLAGGRPLPSSRGSLDRAFQCARRMNRKNLYYKYLTNILPNLKMWYFFYIYLSIHALMNAANKNFKLKRATENDSSRNYEVFL